MKKLYTDIKFKQRQNRRLNKVFRKIHNKFRKLLAYKNSVAQYKLHHGINRFTQIKETIFAPFDFRLIDNTEGCLAFFKDLRNPDNYSIRGDNRFVVMSLKNVVKIDYGTISILKAVTDDLKCKKILLLGDFPCDNKCKQFIVESGFLNNMINSKTKQPFELNVVKSELIFFEKGVGQLSVKDNKKISSTVKNVVRYLTNEYTQCLAVKTILLEICGNSIEWGGEGNNQWHLGVKYEDEKVIFTVTDIGKGILKTLHKKFAQSMADFVMNRKSHEILFGAFEKKYGSSTKEINRNKGLPSIKKNFEIDVIRNLKVVTNNVILHFDLPERSISFEKSKFWLKGTFYQWEMTKECIKNLTIKS